MWVTIKNETVPQGMFRLSYLVGQETTKSPYKLEYICDNATKIIHIGYYSYKFMALLAMKRRCRILRCNN